MKIVAIAVFAGIASLIAGMAPARAALQCVRMAEVRQTSIIDDHTILITLNQKGGYKRADLESPCSGLNYTGFVISTPDNQICNVGMLHILDGEICAIKDIVDINADEAKALLKHAHR